MQISSDSSLPIPSRLTAELGRRFPTAWRQFDRARAERSHTLGTQPTWLTESEFKAAILRITNDGKLPDVPSTGDLINLYAFGTWRVTQGLYQFDHELRAALTRTPIDIKLPASLLTRLPEWAVYIETTGLSCWEKPIAGVIATLSSFLYDGHLALVMTFIPEDCTSLSEVINRYLRLDDSSLCEQLTTKIFQESDIIGNQARNLTDAFFRNIQDWSDLPAPYATLAPDDQEAVRSMFSQQLINKIAARTISDVAAEWAPFIALLLYLCTDEADVIERPARPQGTITKKGVRFFAPDRPQVWPIGTRIGAALRKSQEAYDRNAANARLTGRLRPHWRAAHFASYWLGPRLGERTRHLRWLMPIAVNSDLVEDGVLPAVIRPVKGEADVNTGLPAFP